MPITSSISRAYFWKMIAMAIVSAALAAWGAYDLWVSIPAQEEHYQRYAQAQERRDALQKRVDEGQRLMGDEREEYETLEAALKDTEMPTPPRALDRFVQWLFISSILIVPWCFMQIAKVKKNAFTLHEDGSLSMRCGQETWTREEIADIDMSRWMAKSIAFAIHRDGRRVKMDAYMQKNLEHVIGGIAHRFYPDQWHPDGKMVRSSVNTPANGDDALGHGDHEPSPNPVEPGLDPEPPHSSSEPR